MYKYAWLQSKQTRIHTKGKDWRLQVMTLCSKPFRGPHVIKRKRQSPWAGQRSLHEVVAHYILLACSARAPLGALCWSSNTSGMPRRRALGPAIPCALNILSSNIPIVHCLSSLFFYFIGFHSITLFSAYFEIIIFKPLNLEFICYLVIDY